MSDCFNFAKFREIVTSTSEAPCCAWTQQPTPNGNIIVCSEATCEETNERVIKWLLKAPQPTRFADIPHDLYPFAFCTKHQISAIQSCNHKKEPWLDAKTPSTPAPRIPLTMTSTVNVESPFRFGDHQRSSFDFVSDQPPPFHIDDMERNVDVALSKDRLLKVFHVGEDLQKTVVKDVAENPASTFGRHSPIIDVKNPLSYLETPEKSVEGEENRRLSTPVNATPKRLSLSREDESRRSISKYGSHKSPNRSRSPSVQPLDYRGKVAYATMQGDTSYELPPQDNEKLVVGAVMRPFASDVDGKKGSVYAIRDPELDLVKIGFTTVPVENRLKSLRSQCKLPDTVHIVHDPRPARLMAFRRLETLVHADLRPHRWYFDCACGLNSKSRERFREHHEWYDISDDTAIQTIHLWTDFLLQDPYGVIRIGQSHGLLDKWVRRFKQRSAFPHDESHDDHERRVQRWKSVFKSAEGTTPNGERHPHSSDRKSLIVKLERDITYDARTSEETALRARSPAILSIHEPLPSIETTTTSSAGMKLSTTDASEEIVHDEQVTSSLKRDSEVNLPLSSPPTLSENDHIKVRESSGAYIATELKSVKKEDDSLPRTRHASNSFGHLEDSTAGTQTEPTTASKLEDSLFTKTGLGLQSNDAVADILEILMEKRCGLPERSIHSDLIRFRWPFACSVLIALHTPYAPATLSLFTWMIFLPFFVGALREWF